MWGPTIPGSPRATRTHLMRLRQKLGEDGENPTYIFSEPRVGYRMVEGDTMERIGEVSLPDALPLGYKTIHISITELSTVKSGPLRWAKANT